MAVEAHVKMLMEGAGAWTAWRLDNPNVVPDLSGLDFGGMDVSGVDFCQADLRGAQLGSVIGLLPASLAGADLTRAELPAELSEFSALAHVAEVSRHARVNFLAVIASCVFCWLTIAQTSDGALIANRGQMPLPVINSDVPVTGFFLFAPAILLALYVYLQLYLQRMWDGLSRLPAVFPDGARLDQKAFPWLLSGLISLYIPRLRKGAPPFAWLQVLLSVVAAWLLVPATIAWFWLRYLLVTDGLGIAPHIILLALAIAFGLLSYRRAHVSLLGTQVPPRRVGWLPAPRIVAPLLVLAAALGASVAATYGLWFSAALWHLDFTGEEIRNKADLEDLGSRPLVELELIDLQKVSFRHAEGRKASLVRVDFTKADLSNSKFHAADLRGAVLTGATLTGVKFVDAKLEGAVFADTRLDGAEFTRASGLAVGMFANACGEGVKLPSDLSVKPCESPEIQVAAVGEEEPSIDLSSKIEETQVAVGVYNREPGADFRDCKECPVMVVVPAGEFLMGSPEDEDGRFADEGPQHGVRIAAPFAVGRHEVTFAEWDACFADGKCNDHRPDDSDWGRENRPVINVSWKDAQAYAAWLSEKTQESYRLLSEAEWEYAARAGTRTPFSFGRTITPEQANYYGNRRKTVPVGSYPANAFGLHDMHGNVWEWVEDCWRDSFSGAPGYYSAGRSGDCSRRVVRGGSWGNEPRSVRSAVRSRDRPGVRDLIVGFRVARTLDR